MGLTSRSAHSATLKTILFVLILPWFLSVVGLVLLMPLLMLTGIFQATASMPGWIEYWMPVLMTALYGLFGGAKNAFFIRWSWRRLNAQFRDRVASVKPAPRQLTPPPLPPAVPPVVAQPSTGG
jgi:hypothetical protein